MIDIKRQGIWNSLLGILLIFGVAAPLHAVAWLPFGPDGGDVRSFAADPANAAHVYMGTADGWIYESTDDGMHWQRLARVGRRDDLVLDGIVVDRDDPRHILVGAYTADHLDGGLFTSEDSGRTWTSSPALRGQSVRAVAAAPSDPKIVVAGALSGVYRSQDGGRSWERISPAGSTEIHEIESLAVDPHDPATIYAGTWHLAWKTTDGGAHWRSIKDGVIEDSDVFSIIVDQRDAKMVYASACSGIYKSENGGELFKKVQGIPSTARRTRVLMQDPVHPEIVFAGTTEGLWRTSDAGTSWIRMTRPEDIINDIYIDPRHTDHMLVATDRGGVLVSDDGGFTYKPSNRGFSARQIAAYTADLKNPAQLYVGVVNDKDYGGVFASADGGISWSQREDGLNGRDVFALTVAPDNTLIAGTNHGIFSWQDPLWQRYGTGADAPPAPVAENERTGVPPLWAMQRATYQTVSMAKHSAKKKAAPKAVAKSTPRSTPIDGYDGAVFALLTDGNAVYAATEDGLLMSPSSGTTWRQVASAGEGPLRYLAAGGGKLLAADLKSMEVSTDGAKWTPVRRPVELTQLAGVAVDGAGELWAVGGEGILFTRDNGAHWEPVPKLDLNDVNSVYYDAAADRVLVTANNASTFACAIAVTDKSVQCWDTGWHLRQMRPVGDHFVGVTLFDGVVVQPRMVESR
jgi:photosystem II stability/assembly factor-like uncharacterized protein